ncbi:hypothetical protein HDU81_007713 [Chytriomyces hyalinus]|nr:hypothetical protein HDU81_007713 [Chytriomyces hyalinus]
MLSSLTLTTLCILASTATAQTTLVDVGGACGNGFMANTGPQCKPGLICTPGQISDGPGTCQPSNPNAAVAPDQPPQTPMSPEGGDCGGALMCSAGLKCEFPETGGASTGTCRLSEADTVGSAAGTSPILLLVTETSTAQMTAGFAAIATASSMMSSATAPVVTMASIPLVFSTSTKTAATGTKTAGGAAAATGTIKASGAWNTQASILVISLLSLVF